MPIPISGRTGPIVTYEGDAISHSPSTQIHKAHQRLKDHRVPFPHKPPHPLPFFVFYRTILIPCSGPQAPPVSSLPSGHPWQTVPTYQPLLHGSSVFSAPQTRATGGGKPALQVQCRASAPAACSKLAFNFLSAGANRRGRRHRIHRQGLTIQLISPSHTTPCHESVEAACS